MNRSSFFSGIRAQLPILLGVAPFGMIYGVLARSAGLPPEIAQAMSSIVFAGSSQFIGTTLFRESAPFIVIELTTFVVNLRHALYSASLAPYVESLPLRWKLLIAYLLTDEGYAVGIVRYQQLPSNEIVGSPHYYYLGGALVSVDNVAALYGDWSFLRGASASLLGIGLCPADHLHRHYDPRAGGSSFGVGGSGRRRGGVGGARFKLQAGFDLCGVERDRRRVDRGKIHAASN